MRTPQELQKLLSRLYLAKAQADEQVAGADAADCDCKTCQLFRTAKIGIQLQIDVVLYTLGAESTISAFMAAGDLREEQKQTGLERLYAERDAQGAQGAQEFDNSGVITNARFN